MMNDRFNYTCDRDKMLEDITSGMQDGVQAHCDADPERTGSMLRR